MIVPQAIALMWALLAAGTATAGDVPNATAWIYRGDAARTGYAGGPSPTKLTLAWEFHDELAMFASSPLVVGNVLYGASCVFDPPTSRGAIYCLDATTGKVRWSQSSFITAAGKKQGFKGFFSSPAVSADGRYLVIGQGVHNDANCALICVETATGKVHWTAPTPLHLECSPAIEGDVAVCGAGAIESAKTHLPVGNSGFAFAVRISDGARLWDYPVVDPESAPVIADGIAYIGSGMNGNALVALRIASDDDLKAQNRERLLWRTPTPYPAGGAVTLTRDLAIVGCGNGDYTKSAKDPGGCVIAVERGTGAVRWTTPLPDTVLGEVAVRDGVAICPVRNGEVIALDVATGAIRWRQSEPKERISRKGAVLAGVAFTDRLIYAVSQDGYLAIIDPKTGLISERIYLNSKRRAGELGLGASSPFVSGGRVYVGSETGGIRCLQATP
jgi:outer membrane protein assembly factor BamB